MFVYVYASALSDAIFYFLFSKHFAARMLCSRKQLPLLKYLWPYSFAQNLLDTKLPLYG